MLEILFKYGNHTCEELDNYSMKYTIIIIHQDELLEKVVLTVLQSLHNDPNTAVRHRAVQFLVRLCYRCFSDKFYHIVNIILKVIIRLII